jgi:hypothetical protein
MRHTLTNCKNCKAGPEFVRVTSEPGNGAQITFCGRCHHVLSSQTDSTQAAPPVDHMKAFAKSMSHIMMSLSGSEVISNVFLEGVKSGVDMALSVPWSQKENFWMEKYGVVKTDLIKELEAKLASIRSMEKTASSAHTDGQIAMIEEQLQQLKAEL